MRAHEALHHGIASSPRRTCDQQIGLVVDGDLRALERLQSLIWRNLHPCMLLFKPDLTCMYLKEL
jgi:hypothetical protein